MSWSFTGIAADAWDTLGGNMLLNAFSRSPIPDKPVNKDAARLKDAARPIADALDEKRWDDVDKLYMGLGGVFLTAKQRRSIESALLGSEEGRQALADRPKLAGAVLSAADPRAFQDVDLSSCFGDAKDNVMSEAVMAISRKRVPQDGMALDREEQCDPARFSILAQQIPPDVWNDTGGGLARKRGLGPIVCGQLWAQGNFDPICELIDHGVDTSTSAPHQVGMRAKNRGGRVQPIQHVLSPLLKKVGELPPVDDPRTAPAKGNVEGARKILATLDAQAKLDPARGSATQTSYAAVQSSEMLTAFQENPGTIWGFEEVRQPYVQAAHETNQGKEPLRMLELWEAVGPTTTDYDTYESLLDDPDKAVKELVRNGREKVEAGIRTKDPKFAEIAGKEDAYLAKFEQFATKFLKEFGQLMPKGTAARPKLDDGGAAKRNESVSDAAGILPGGLMAGLACKAGLWWAKEEGAPVYYCLDGVNMADVTDYKKVKNKTIEAFIAKGADAKPEDRHNEGITMVELREILKNWEELKGTVIFVEKGVILKDGELDKKITKWRKDLKDANTDAGKSLAPPKATFTGELNKIRADLLARIPDTEDGNREARSIVHKFGCLEKIARTKPHIALNYLMSKCGVLVTYDIIPAELPKAAAELIMINSDAPEGVMMEACAAVKAALARCHPDLQKPLEAALLRHPLMDKLKIRAQAVQSL
jgi:hypothetical protein